MSDKAQDALKTISEVAALLDVPPHVLRFWEGKFTRLRPLKRSGGRRYYRLMISPYFATLENCFMSMDLQLRSAKTDK